MYVGRKKPERQSKNKIIETIENRIIRENLFEQEQEKYYKPVRVGNFYSNNYIKYESDGYLKNQTLSTEEYLDEVKPYLKDMINDLKKSDTWKIQLTVEINIVPSKDTDVEHEIHSRSDNLRNQIYDKEDEVIEELC